LGKAYTYLSTMKAVFWFLTLCSTVAGNCRDLGSITCPRNLSCILVKSCMCQPPIPCDTFDEDDCLGGPMHCAWVDRGNRYTCAGECQPEPDCSCGVYTDQCFDRPLCYWESRASCVAAAEGCFWMAGTENICHKSLQMNNGGICLPCSSAARGAFSKHVLGTCSWPAGGNFSQGVSLTIDDYAPGSKCPPIKEDNLPALTTFFSGLLKGKLNESVTCAQPPPSPAPDLGGWGLKDILPAILVPLFLLALGIGFYYWRSRRAKQTERANLLSSVAGRT